MTIQFDAIKIAYKQDREGFVVTFRIHPADDHRAIGDAAIGSQWQLTCVELDEDGNPESEVMPNSREQLPVPDKTQPASEQPARANRLTQQAAIACNDPRFQSWLKMTFPDAWKIMNLGDGPAKAAAVVRWHCGVKSRKEILPGTPAARRWDELYSRFTAWKLVV